MIINRKGLLYRLAYYGMSEEEPKTLFKFILKILSGLFISIPIIIGILSIIIIVMSSIPFVGFMTIYTGVYIPTAIQEAFMLVSAVIYIVYAIYPLVQMDVDYENEHDIE